MFGGPSASVTTLNHQEPVPAHNLDLRAFIAAGVPSDANAHRGSDAQANINRNFPEPETFMYGSLGPVDSRGHSARVEDAARNAIAEFLTNPTSIADIDSESDAGKEGVRDSDDEDHRDKNGAYLILLARSDLHWESFAF